MQLGLISVAAALVLTGIDQLIKVWAANVLQPLGVMAVIPGVVELRYYLNDGMAFSLLAGKQGLLIAVTSLMLVCVLVALFCCKFTLLERASWTLVLGGGIGNLIDRIANGVVIDYINPLFINFAVFNFADICVCTGIGLLVLSIVLDMVRDAKKDGAQGNAVQDEPDPALEEVAEDAPEQQPTATKDNTQGGDDGTP